MTGPAAFAPDQAPEPLSVSDELGASVLPRGARGTLHVLLLLLAAGILWLSFARVDIVVVSEGKIQPVETTSVLQAFETSVVRSVNVRVGDRVRKGEVVATLDPTFAEADAQDQAGRVAADNAVIARVEAELAGQDYDPAAPSKQQSAQISLFRHRKEEHAAALATAQAKIAELSSESRAAAAQLPELEAQEQALARLEGIERELAAKGLASQLRLLSAQSDLAEVRAKILGNRGDQARLAEQVRGAVAERDRTQAEWQRKLEDEYVSARADLLEATALLEKAHRRRQLVQLTAPLDGTVLNIAKRAPGSVLRAAETLITILPDRSTLRVDAAIRTRDIAWIHSGAAALIKLEALPYQEFGSLKGHVETVSADTVQAPELAGEADSADDQLPQERGDAAARPAMYRAQIAIDANELRNAPRDFHLRPGMRVTVDIKVGTRSILNYLLNPLAQVFDESFREP